MRTTALCAALVCLGLLSGCANLASDYSRPELPVPATVDRQATSGRMATFGNQQAIFGELPVDETCHI